MSIPYIEALRFDVAFDIYLIAHAGTIRVVCHWINRVIYIEYLHRISASGRSVRHKAKRTEYASIDATSSSDCVASHVLATL